jgi:hypothetical protein
VYPALGSPKKMGPPEAAAPGLWVVTKPGVVGERGALPAFVTVPLGKVSKDKVRIHEARTMEKEEGTTGSWVEV